MAGGLNVANVVKIITDTFTATVTGIGSGVVDLFDKLFVGADGNLTTFSTYAFLWLGISLATGLITFLISKLG